MEILAKTLDRPAVESREKFFEDLYENAFPIFTRFAARMNAPFDDAKDVFHDALIIYYEKSLQPGFAPKTSPEAYILGIAKHLWIRKFTQDRNKISLDSLEASISIPAGYFPEVNEIRLLSFLERTGKKCLDLLRKFYYEKMPLKDIAAALRYRSIHSATVQKFKCIGKMRDAIRSNSINYEDFF